MRLKGMPFLSCIGVHHLVLIQLGVEIPWLYESCKIQPRGRGALPGVIIRNYCYLCATWWLNSMTPSYQSAKRGTSFCCVTCNCRLVTKNHIKISLFYLLLQWDDVSCHLPLHPDKPCQLSWHAAHKQEGRNHVVTKVRKVDASKIYCNDIVHKALWP